MSRKKFFNQAEKTISKHGETHDNLSHDFVNEVQRVAPDDVKNSATYAPYKKRIGGTNTKAKRKSYQRKIRILKKLRGLA